MFHMVEESPYLRLFGALNSAVVHLNEPKPKPDPAASSPAKDKSLKNSSFVIDPKKTAAEETKPAAELNKPSEQKKVTFEDALPPKDAGKQTEPAKKPDAPKKTEDLAPKKTDDLPPKKTEDLAPKKAEDAPKKTEDAPKKAEDAPKKPADNKPATENTKQDAPQNQTKPADQPKKPEDQPKAPQDGKPADQATKPQDPKKPQPPTDQPGKPPADKPGEKKADQAPKQPEQPRAGSTEKLPKRKADLNTSLEADLPQDMSESKVLGFNKSTFKPSLAFALDTSSTVEGDRKHEWKGTRG
jgi:hypothetical protein